MRREELRIGNWFWSTGDMEQEDGEWRLKQVEPHDLFNPYKFPEFGKPVELTEEWLRGFGFEESIDSWGGFLIEIGNSERIRLVEVEGIGWCWPLNGYKHPETKYVHQVQNLFYCLSGEELPNPAKKP